MKPLMSDGQACLYAKPLWNERQADRPYHNVLEWASWKGEDYLRTAKHGI